MSGIHKFHSKLKERVTREVYYNNVKSQLNSPYMVQKYTPCGHNIFQLEHQKGADIKCSYSLTHQWPNYKVIHCVPGRIQPNNSRCTRIKLLKYVPSSTWDSHEVDYFFWPYTRSAVPVPGRNFLHVPSPSMTW